jgi:ABC-type iron transport system FetAB ATPase subunit
VKIALQQVAVVFDDTPVLAPFDLSLVAGEYLRLRGPSGSGKSTCLRLFNGLLQPTAGTVTWSESGAVLTDISGIRARIGYLHQVPVMVPGTVEDNLRYPWLFQGRAGCPAPPAAALAAALTDVGLTGALLGRAAAELSVGQQQRVALARALLTAPDVLLCDEPCAALDAESAAVVDQRLLALHAAGAAVVVASHVGSMHVPASCREIVVADGCVSEDDGADRGS